MRSSMVNIHSLVLLLGSSLSLLLVSQVLISSELAHLSDAVSRKLL
jgi:hypothetical protein